MSNKTEQTASLTLIKRTDGKIEAVLMSHPDGNDMEKMLDGIMQIINAIIAEQNKQKGTPS